MSGRKGNRLRRGLDLDSAGALELPLTQHHMAEDEEVACSPSTVTRHCDRGLVPESGRDYYATVRKPIRPAAVGEADLNADGTVRSRHPSFVSIRMRSPLPRVML